MADYDLVVGDGGTKLRVTITDRLTQLPLDLTGRTATLRYRINGGAVQEKTMTLLNQSTALGQAEYQFLTADLASSGEMTGEVVLQDGLSDQLTTVDNFHLNIKAALA